MSMAHLPRRKGYVSPSVNACGTDSIGYTCETNPLKGFRFSNSSVASEKVTGWHIYYSSAMKELRRKEKEQWKP